MPDLFSGDTVLKPVDLSTQAGIIPFVTHDGTVKVGELTLTLRKLSTGELVVPLDDLRMMLRHLDV